MEHQELQNKLAAYQQNLAALEVQIKNDPTNEQLISLRNNIREYIELTKDLLGIGETANETTYSSSWMNQPTEGLTSKNVAGKEVAVGQYVSVFAPQYQTYVNAIVTEAKPGTATVTVTLLGYGQALEVQIPSIRQAEFCRPSDLQVGMMVEGIYSADGYWYTARIDQVQPDGKYFVTYTDYGNSESIDIRHIRINPALLGQVDQDDDDAKGKGKANDKKRKSTDDPTDDPALADFVIPEKLKIRPMDTEDVKAQKRKKIHALKSAHRMKKSEAEKNQKAQSWTNFAQKAGSSKSKLKGFMSTTKKESIFKTTEEGKVGVTGSGKGITNWQQLDIHSVKKAQNLATRTEED
mmetsp:Transcript_41348/g.130128  ORF Transcript_41348/g.130128 Transcript_41348/m.130128 type:complete len:351 (+) Transcript_41348:64-1116(+)